MNRSKLGVASIRVLRNLANGRPADYDCCGRSMYGGLTKALLALRKRGLIDKEDALTGQGWDIVAKLRLTDSRP